MITIFDFFILLLIPLLGAKSVLAFSFWGSLLTCYLLKLTTNKPQFRIPVFSIFALLILTYLQQTYSVVQDLTWFGMLKFGVYLACWHFFIYLRKENHSFHEQTPVSIDAISVVSIVSVLFQKISHSTQYGFIPLNPTFQMTLLAALTIYYFGQRLSEQYPRKLVTKNLVLGTLCGVLVIFSSSRGAFIALFLSSLYLSWFRFRPKRIFFTVTLLFLALPFFIPDEWISNRFQIGSDLNLSWYRPQIWLTAWKSFLDHPITGYGFGNFEYGYFINAFPVEQSPVRYCFYTGFAHNEYLNLLACGGLTALACVLLFFWKGWKVFLQSSHDPHDLTQKAVCLSFSISAFFNPVWHMPLLVIISLWFLSALVKEDLLTKKTIPLPLTGLFHKWATLLTLFVLLLGCIHLGVRTFLLTHRRTDLALWMAKDDVSALILQKSFLSAVRKSARNPFLHEAAGIQKRLEKNDAEALIHYQNAAQYAPFRATYQFQIGEIYFARKNYRKALEYYHAAIHLEPNYWNAYDRLIQLLIQMKQLEKAKAMRDYFTERYRHISQKYRDSNSDLYSKQILSYDPVKNPLK